MTIFGQMIWGRVAKFALARHYRCEVQPYAASRGHDRSAVKKAAHRAIDRLFDKAWPPHSKEESR